MRNPEAVTVMKIEACWTIPPSTKMLPRFCTYRRYYSAHTIVTMHLFHKKDIFPPQDKQSLIIT